MTLKEYFEVQDFSYAEYCEYLQSKYGKPADYYFAPNFAPNGKIKKAESDGLFVHHIKENEAANLSNEAVAKNYPYDYQSPDNLCYCDMLEHLLLHILIYEDVIDNKDTDVKGIGGALNYIIPQLNDFYAGWRPTTSQFTYLSKVVEVVENSIVVYKMLIHRLSASFDVTSNFLKEVVCKSANNYEAESKNLYEELKEAVGNGSVYLQSHNSAFYSELKDALAKDKKALLVLGTSLGKTTTALQYLYENNIRGLVVCPTNKIKEGWNRSSEFVDTIGYQTLRNSYEKIDYSKYGLIIYDEVHHAAAPEWGKSFQYILNNVENIKILGMTATTEYNNGKNDISELFGGSVVNGIDALQGIERGILHPVSYIGAYYTIPEELKALAKEDDTTLTKQLKSRLNFAINNTPSLKTIFTTNMPEGKRKGIIFVSTIEDMDEAISIVKGIYPDIEYRKIHSKMDSRVVREYEEWFEKTDEGYLCSVGKISEGVHFSGINTLIMFRKTRSKNLFMQQLGRVMVQTKFPNPNCIVFDLVNNAYNIREYTRRLIEASRRVGVVRTIRGTLNRNPLPGAEKDKVSSQVIIADYSEEITKIWDEVKDEISGRWAEWEDDIIRKYYPDGGVKECLKYLPKRNKGSICTRAYELNVKYESDIWTVHEDDIIRKYYCDGGPKECLKYLPNRSVWSIMVRANKLNIKSRRWTVEEDNIIRKYYLDSGVKECLKYLPNKSADSIVNRANRLNIKHERNTWAIHEDDIIRKYYSNGGPKECLKYLPDRSKKSIMKRARKLNIKCESGIWTIEEDNIIRKYYPGGGAEECLKYIFDRSEDSIRVRARKLNIKCESDTWTVDEDDILKKYYPIEGVRGCMKRLKNRTSSAIAHRAKRLKLKSLSSAKSRQWTIEEDEIIRKYYPKEGGNVYLRLKNRTYKTVANRASVLGVRKCCKGESKTAGGYHWEEVEENKCEEKI